MQLTKTQFESLYGSSGLTFPDNTTAEISESDIRAFGQDAADSLFFKGDGIPYMKIRVAKSSHGFAIGDVLTVDATGYVKISNTTTQHFVAIINEVPDTDTFVGVIDGLATGLTGLTPGSYYYATNSGTLSTTPSDIPILLAFSSSSGFVSKSVPGAGGSAPLFSADVTFVLSSGKSFGKYTNGQTAAWTGMTAIEALIDAAIEYINPSFGSFTYSGISTTEEIGTTLSGSKTFTWSITLGSGTVATIDIYDITAASTLLAATINDGTQAQTITTIQLNADGATQQWRGVGNDSGGGPATFNSSTLTVTARFKGFFGPTSANPATSADVRALPSNAFVTSGNIVLATGNTLTKFAFCIPATKSIASVIDESALFADITSSYVLASTFNVLDAGGTNRSYKVYVMTIGAAYGASHNHRIYYN